MNAHFWMNAHFYGMIFKGFFTYGVSIIGYKFQGCIRLVPLLKLHKRNERLNTSMAAQSDLVARER